MQLAILYQLNLMNDQVIAGGELYWLEIYYGDKTTYLEYRLVKICV